MTAAGERPVQVLVMAKAPVPGRVKTRLCPPVSTDGAALLAEAALRDTLETVSMTPVTRRAVALDGPAGSWLPGGIPTFAQRGGGLDERLEAAAADAWVSSPLPLIMIGMDTPQVTPALLTRAADELLAPGTGAVLGPACDGGYWCIGIRHPQGGVFHGVPMSTPLTCTYQLERLALLELSCTALPTMRDVDHVSDAYTVASEVPHSRFARTLRKLRLEQAGAKP